MALNDPEFRYRVKITKFPSSGERVVFVTGKTGVALESTTAYTMVHQRGQHDLSDVMLAYAMTVHKSQGSQFQGVIVPIQRSRILDRTLIYTAVTRATDQVVLVGDAGVLTKAVKDPTSASRRRIGLRAHLK